VKFIVKFPRTLENSQDGGTFDQHLPFAMEEPTFIQQDFDLVNLNKGVEYFYLDLKEVNVVRLSRVNQGLYDLLPDGKRSKKLDDHLNDDELLQLIQFNIENKDAGRFKDSQLKEILNVIEKTKK
jgi:hypothetical protein